MKTKTLKINDFRKEFDKFLRDHLERLMVCSSFSSIINYTPLTGGKRLRPYLIALFSQAIGLPSELYMKLGVAVELFHSGSLIHDDLPAIDNDDFRRGKPSLHKAFDEASAILAGDFLMLYPVKVLQELPINEHLKFLLINEWIRTALSIIEGEYLDVTYEPSSNTKDVNRIHRLKTAELFGFCFSSPFICADRMEEAKKMKETGLRFGHIFQVLDDIKDKLQPIEILGKTPGKDEKLNRPSILRFMSSEEALNTSEKDFKTLLENIEYPEVCEGLKKLWKLIVKA